MAAAALFRVEGSPNGEPGDGGGGGIIEEDVVAGWRAGKGDFGAFAFDEGVEGEIGGPVGWEVVGAAVRDEADLSIMMRRVNPLLWKVAYTYNGIRSDFAPRPFPAFAHRLERILLRKAEDIASMRLRQTAH